MVDWEKLHCYVVYDNKYWSIDIRKRNNPHEGEPDMKVWVSECGREVAQFSESYRGYGRYKDHEELIPEEVAKKAKKTWVELKNGVYTEAKLEKLKEKFIERYEKRTEESLKLLSMQLCSNSAVG